MYENAHNDQGSPEASGSGLGAPRRPRTGKPEYVTLLENKYNRRLAAAQLGIRVEQLRTIDGGTAEQEAADATAELLDDLIDALRAVLDR